MTDLTPISSDQAISTIRNGEHPQWAHGDYRLDIVLIFYLDVGYLDAYRSDDGTLCFEPTERFRCTTPEQTQDRLVRWLIQHPEYDEP